jgi:hypothetical protein
MKEENKYYTPKIEEFYAGFEYERCDDGYSYFKDIYPRAIDTNKLENYLPYFRVKYLDREDIESLGWVHTGKSIDDWFKWGNKVRLESGHSISFKMHYGYHDQKLTINGDDGGSETCFFEGYVKNKSEFKKVMEQLTINKL